MAMAVAKSQKVHEDRFLYLMSADIPNRNGESTKRLKNRIGDASNPFYRIMSQNRRTGYPRGSKSTGSGAPYWKLDLIIGPFTCGATLFKKRWQHQTRELSARILRGIMLAKAQQTTKLRVFARDPDYIYRLLVQRSKKQR